MRLSVPRLLHALASVILPARCAACGQVLEFREGDICGPCSFALRRHLGPVSPRFAERLVNTGNWSWLALGGDGLEKALVHRMKYGGQRHLGVELGKAMAREAPMARWPGPQHWAVIPIPLHPRKRRRRGFNQSQLLASGWCAHTGMALEPMLTRIRHRTSLTRLNRQARLGFLDGVYALRPDAAEVLAPYRGVLLVDDVITTGSTMEAAWTALRMAWDGPIDFVTLLDAAG